MHAFVCVPITRACMHACVYTISCSLTAPTHPRAHSFLSPLLSPPQPSLPRARHMLSVIDESIYKRGVFKRMHAGKKIKAAAYFAVSYTRARKYFIDYINREYLIFRFIYTYSTVLYVYGIFQCHARARTHTHAHTHTHTHTLSLSHMKGLWASLEGHGFRKQTLRHGQTPTPTPTGAHKRTLK